MIGVHVIHRFHDFVITIGRTPCLAANFIPYRVSQYPYFLSSRWCHSTMHFLLFLFCLSSLRPKFVILSCLTISSNTPVIALSSLYSSAYYLASRRETHGRSFMIITSPHCRQLLSFSTTYFPLILQISFICQSAEPSLEGGKATYCRQ
jgi:hypothetical protein